MLDHFILFCIGCNSITMAMERPAIEDDSLERAIITVSGFTFMAIFFVEFCAKIIAWGMFFGPTAYFTNAWNRLDGFPIALTLTLTLTLLGTAGSMVSWSPLVVLISFSSSSPPRPEISLTCSES